VREVRRNAARIVKLSVPKGTFTDRVYATGREYVQELARRVRESVRIVEETTRVVELAGQGRPIFCYRQPVNVRAERKAENDQQLHF
jgi:hypothetical protein